ncbi:endo-alpha-1,5-arabinanase precursor [Tothia fuscella]|uniref:Arabinan endo-1,5-alpha-L-arabinosidase n=1 Tax=Tothia fuscella TaxID=1048955 RepID=A0A9P4NRM7_9PEZI|nr:endo-alpha-1,5-arabinanase precursor [Tothia fuscella]
MLFIPSLLFSSSTLIASVAAFANPGPCSGICGNSHDPALIRRSDGTYFRFSTGNRINIASAPSISGPWTSKGSAIKGGSKIQKKGNQDLWAPDVTKVGDTYYLLYSVSSFGTQDSEIGYATSSNLESWTDHGSTGVGSSKGKPYNAIDGQLVSRGNEHYMAWGSFWQDLFIAPMSNPPTKKAGGDKQIAYQPGGEHAVEAPYIFEHEGFWYLFYSAGKCCALDKQRPARGAEYKIMACRSKSVTGPYADQGGKDCKQGGGHTVLPSHDWVYAPGGQGVYKDPKEGPVVYYHYVDTRIGYSDGQKKFGWNRLNFKDGWPTV